MEKLKKIKKIEKKVKEKKGENVGKMSKNALLASKMHKNWKRQWKMRQTPKNKHKIISIIV